MKWGTYRTFSYKLHNIYSADLSSESASCHRLHRGRFLVVDASSRIINIQENGPDCD